MRKYLICPTPNQLRIRRAFLWSPKTIMKERRWLERASWTEKYYYADFGKGRGMGGWMAIHWGEEIK